MIKNIIEKIANKKTTINLLIGFLTFIALLGLHYFNGGYADLHRGLIYPYMLVIGFPLLFILKNHYIKGSLITLFSCVFFLRQSWICWVSLLISMIILYWDKRKIIIPLAIIALMTLSFMGKAWKNQSIQGDWNSRVATWQSLTTNWQNQIWGDGADKVVEYKATMKNQIQAGCPQAHNDWLHIAVERGIVVMLPLALIFFIPIVWIRFDTLFYRALWASYISLGIQTMVDFPLHRMITLPLAITILLLVWGECDRSILQNRWRTFLNS